MALDTSHGWRLQEWFAYYGLKQADLVTKLDYQKNSAFRIWHGLQQYRREDVEAIAGHLNVQPYELLMTPDEAMSLRRLRSAIAEVADAGKVDAADSSTTDTPASPERRRAG